MHKFWNKMQLRMRNRTKANEVKPECHHQGGAFELGYQEHLQSENNQ